MRHLVSTDGLAVKDIAAMDMDAFREWLWPGVVAKRYRVDVPRQGWPWAYRANKRIGSGIPYKYGSGWTVFVYASSGDNAEKKARAMVDGYIAPKPCVMDNLA